MEEPLLFIQTPPFYYIEVKPLEESPVEEETIEEEPINVLEESTSVYELSRTERMNDPVIARQLNYFLQPANQHRSLTFHLLNGDEEVGKIEELIGLQLKVINNEQELYINANDIKAITTNNSI